MTVLDGRLIAGGSFLIAGGNVSAYWARWDDCFPAPTVTGITPSAGANNGDVSITNLAGTEFRAGATAALRKNGQTDVPASSVAVVNPTQITCTFNLSGAATGVWDAVVTYPDGRSCELTSGFSITPPPPTVTSVTPDDGYIYSSGCGANAIIIAFSASVRGPGGAPLSAADFEVDGSSVGVTAFSYDDATHTVSFSFPELSDAAWHTIRVSGAIEGLFGSKLDGNTSAPSPGNDHYWIDLGVLRADFQKDGDVDVFDRTQFLAAWTSRDLRSDYQCDGDIDVFHRTQFLASWTLSNATRIGPQPSH